jgi:hypothetical protein
MASEVICQAVSSLKQLGFADAIIIQTDGGSDFTSHTFQAMCSCLGTWIRSKVSQQGGSRSKIRNRLPANQHAGFSTSKGESWRDSTAPSNISSSFGMN